MAGPSIGVWVKVRNKVGGMTARVIANKFGGGLYEHGEVITQAQYNFFREKRQKAIAEKEAGKKYLVDAGKNTDRISLHRDQKHLRKPQERDEVVNDFIFSRESKRTRKVQLHGMPEPEKMVSITMDKLKIHYPKTVAGRNAAREIVQDILDNNYSDQLTRNTKGIYVTASRSKDDQYWERTYGIPGFRSGATGGDGNVVFYSNRVKEGTLAHEMGHNLAKKIYNNATPTKDSAYYNAHQNGRPVSSYSERSNSLAEDFAESVKAIHVDRRSFLREHPVKFEIIDNLIKGKDGNARKKKR